MNALFDFSWRDVSELVALIALILGLVWLFLRPKIAADFVTKADYSARIAGIDGKLAEVEGTAKESAKGFDARLSRVEADLAALPDKDSFHQLALEIKEQAGDLKAISATVRPLAASVDRIEQHLMDGKK